MSFCTSCGHKLSPDDAFCPNCGTPVKPVARTPPVSPVESELFEIDGQKGLSRHLLVFTDRRLIVGLVGGGKTRLLTAGPLRMVYEGRKVKKMKEQDFADLLSDDKTYTIPYEEINRIVVERGGRLRGGSIIIDRTTGETEKFKVDIRKTIGGFERLMKPVFGDKLVVRH